MGVGDGCNDKYFQDPLLCSGNFYSIVWFSGSNWFSKNFEVVNQELNPNSGSGWFSSGWFSLVVQNRPWPTLVTSCNMGGPHLVQVMHFMEYKNSIHHHHHGLS